MSSLVKKIKLTPKLAKKKRQFGAKIADVTSAQSKAAHKAWATIRQKRIQKSAVSAIAGVLLPAQLPPDVQAAAKHKKRSDAAKKAWQTRKKNAEQAQANKKYRSIDDEGSYGE